jgi:uncharacterized protein with LGFP repeats
MSTIFHWPCSSIFIHFLEQTVTLTEAIGAQNPAWPRCGNVAGPLGRPTPGNDMKISGEY